MACESTEYGILGQIVELLSTIQIPIEFAARL